VSNLKKIVYFVFYILSYDLNIVKIFKSIALAFSESNPIGAINSTLNKTRSSTIMIIIATIATMILHNDPNIFL